MVSRTGEPLADHTPAVLEKIDKLLASSGYKAGKRICDECRAAIGFYISDRTLYDRAQWLKAKKYQLVERKSSKKALLTEDTADRETPEISSNPEFQLEPLTPSERRDKLNLLIDRLLLSWEGGQGVDPKVLLAALEKLSDPSSGSMSPRMADVWQRWTELCQANHLRNPMMLADPLRELECTVWFGEDQLRIADLQRRVSALHPGIKVVWGDLTSTPQQLVDRYLERERWSKKWAMEGIQWDPNGNSQEPDGNLKQSAECFAAVCMRAGHDPVRLINRLIEKLEARLEAVSSSNGEQDDNLPINVQ